MKGASKSNKKPTSADEKIWSDLERLQQSGVEFFIDGEVVPVGDVVRCTVQEPCTYMTDYVLDEKGTVQQVRLDRVDFG